LAHKPSTIGAKLGKLRNLLVPRQLRRFDGLLTVSSAGAREVAERYGMRAPEVLHPPAASIPGNSSSLDRTSRLVAEGLPTGVFLLGLVGRVQVHHKGHDAALRVLRRLVDVGLQVHLVVVGDGPDLETVRALANRLGLSKRISFLGWRDDVGELIPLFNAVIMPSRFEGMPLVALQAAAARVPVVGYAVDGLGELLPPEFTAPASDEAALARTLVDLTRGSLSWPADELARRARSWSDPEEAAVRLLTILESNSRGRAASAGSTPLAKNAEDVQKVLPR
jgi:glycosyltransferase involved in cell wall biosynthesis